ncbi:hypothetical protein ZWY2020_026835 [Hordeum vulgare]|nr:hypothetical protein ZWY2020_026835 [Hordeum vulgare]
MDDLSPRMEMAESDAAAGKMANGEASDDNGRAVEVAGGEDTLSAVLRSFVDGVWPPPGNGGDPLLQRLRAAYCEATPRLWDASRNSARNLLPWTKQGSGLRTILVISIYIYLIWCSGPSMLDVGIILVLMSLAAAGGFLALFFACLVAVYVGAVSIAIFVISTTVISAIVAAMIATGWIGFFWTIWFAARKSLDLTKHSIGMTTSAVQSYSASRRVGQKPTD